MSSPKLYSYINRYNRYCVRAVMNGTNRTFGWCDTLKEAKALAAAVKALRDVQNSQKKN
jgi:hypothetical protein